VAQQQISERAIAQQQQEKFEFYLLSLVFTLLALSVQSAKFGSSSLVDTLELSGWACLLISGIAGLWLMEWRPVLRIHMAQKQEFEEYISQMKELELKGQTKIVILETSSEESIADLIKNRQHAINVLQPTIKKLERYNYIKYDVHRYGFVLGVILVVIARGYPAATDIIKGLLA
jgi:hypothetical protein